MIVKVSPLFSMYVTVVILASIVKHAGATSPAYCVPTPTATHKAKSEKKLTPSATSTRTPTSTRTAVPTQTPTWTPTPILLPTKTPTPSKTATPRPTKTPVCAPTATKSPTSTPNVEKTPSAIASPTNTAVHDATPTPRPTSTLTATSTPSHLVSTRTPTAMPTLTLPPNAPSPNVPSATATTPKIPSPTPIPTQGSTVAPTVSPSPNPKETTPHLSTPTSIATLNPIPEVLTTPPSSSLEPTVAVAPNETGVTMTLVEQPICEEHASFTFECKSSDDSASLAWNSTGYCTIVHIEGAKGEIAQVKMTKSLITSLSDCTLSCTSVNKETFREFSVEQKISGCEFCGSEWPSCQSCGAPGESCQAIDRCGVCGGDGTTCETCSSTDAKLQQGEVDSAALNQKRFLESLIRRASHLQRRGKIKGVPPKLIKVWRGLATPLYTRIWSDVWGSYQGVSTNCAVAGVPSECSSISNEEVLGRITMSADTMRSLGLAIVRALRRGGLPPNATLQLTRSNEAHYLEVIQQVQGLPVAAQSCRPPEERTSTCR